MYRLMHTYGILIHMCMNLVLMYSIHIRMYVFKMYVLYLFLYALYTSLYVCKMYCVLHTPHVTDDDMLQESGIYTGQLMILEVKKDDGTWPRDTYTQGTMVCTVHMYTHHTLHIVCMYMCTHVTLGTFTYVHIMLLILFTHEYCMCLYCTYTHHTLHIVCMYTCTLYVTLDTFMYTSC